ncbi:hypothetical protein ACFQ9X_48005 [Catenulispora yoronensis]
MLTSNVFEAFEVYSASVSGDPQMFAKLFRTDAAAGALLVEHECGRIDQAAFERGSRSCWRLGVWCWRRRGSWTRSRRCCGRMR